MATEKRTILLAAAALAGLAGLSLWRGHGTRATVMLAGALVVVAAGLASSAFARHFHHGWWRAAHAVGAVHTMALLALVYFAGFAGCRIWGRLAGRDSLARRAPPQSSYWVRRTRTHPSPWQFERLY